MCKSSDILSGALERRFKKNCRNGRWSGAPEIVEIVEIFRSPKGLQKLDSIRTSTNFYSHETNKARNDHRENCQFLTTCQLIKMNLFKTLYALVSKNIADVIVIAFILHLCTQISMKLLSGTESQAALQTKDTFRTKGIWNDNGSFCILPMDLEDISNL